MKRIIFVAAAVIIFFFTAKISVYSQESIPDKPKLIIFHSLTCHSCIKVKKEIMPIIEKEYKDRLILEYRDIAEIENYKLLVGLQEKHNIKLTNDMPVFYLTGNFINGEKNISSGWEEFINRGLRAFTKAKPDILPSVDLVYRFKSFTPFVIIGAGLVDGINPCAFTVIVFFISFLAMQGYGKRELTIIGLCFIFSVFMTYLLIGAGVFGFFYRMSHFWLLAKIFNYSIGAFSIVLGVLAVSDFLKFRKTGETGGLALQLPKGVKNQIHKVIGMHYRVNKSTESIVYRRPLFKLIVSALITGFLVSLLEAVCTGQTYLPTITFILKTTLLKLQALEYLLLYNFMFVVPLLAIFIFALFGVTSGQFSDFLKKHLLAIKILMAILFFSLGIFLVFRA
jgi:cytochrome c biogenesis protein CcdA